MKVAFVDRVNQQYAILRLPSKQRRAQEDVVSQLASLLEEIYWQTDWATLRQFEATLKQAVFFRFPYASATISCASSCPPQVRDRNLVLLTEASAAAGSVYEADAA